MIKQIYYPFTHIFQALHGIHDLSDYYLHRNHIASSNKKKCDVKYSQNVDLQNFRKLKTSSYLAHLQSFFRPLLQGWLAK